ncbi:glutathione S-transferase [Pacificimonas flava]|uniref:Glutathione S-transferase n=2 Tax=Pacificimonas TaxID=1960290 RepID=A0A219B826_9SPHN|nr:MULTISPECIES: glutathione S-transferase family protein [Pacificimonas]MBZ6378359.1 glutathione S-transferase family protein [Pacificimonas aurantium]OWV34334.1 glutathione S-transferase [Pacificimonas flava]
MSSIEIVEHPLSPYAQKLKIALDEKGIAYSATLPDGIGSGDTPSLAGESFRGEVPVLRIDGHSLFDSAVILDFIEERWPDPALLPADPLARAHAREIEEVCDTHYEAISWGLGEIRFFGRAKGELADKMEAEAAAQIGRLNAWLETRLGDQDWFGGDRFGFADICAAPFVQGAAGFGNAPATGSRLESWLARVRERPSAAKSFAAAAAVAPSMTDVASLVESGLFKRQYRDHRLEWMIRTGGIEIVQAGLEKNNIRFNSEPS